MGGDAEGVGVTVGSYDDGRIGEGIEDVTVGEEMLSGWCGVGWYSIGE